MPRCGRTRTSTGHSTPAAPTPSAPPPAGWSSGLARLLIGISVAVGAGRPGHPPCACRKLRRGWSGGISVLVDESATAGRFHDLEVSIWLVCSVGGDGRSLIE